MAHCIVGRKGEGKRDPVEREERLTQRQLRTPGRDKDVGSDSKPIEVNRNISMGLGSALCSEMKWRNNEQFWRQTNWEVVEVDGTAV